MVDTAFVCVKKVLSTCAGGSAPGAPSARRNRRDRSGGGVSECLVMSRIRHAAIDSGVAGRLRVINKMVVGVSRLADCKLLGRLRVQGTIVGSASVFPNRLSYGCPTLDPATDTDIISA